MERTVLPSDHPNISHEVDWRNISPVEKIATENKRTEQTRLGTSFLSLKFTSQSENSCLVSKKKNTRRKTTFQNSGFVRPKLNPTHDNHSLRSHLMRLCKITLHQNQLPLRITLDYFLIMHGIVLIDKRHAIQIHPCFSMTKSKKVSHCHSYSQISSNWYKNI